MVKKTAHNQIFRKPIPDKDETTEFGSRILWSKIEIRNPRKNHPSHSGRYVKVACVCGKETLRNVHEIQYMKFRGLCIGCIGKIKDTPSGPKHINWLGGKYTTHQGYVQIHRSAISAKDMKVVKSMFGSRPYIPEHRCVMALHLGRPLKKDEHVHHINNTKTDNRIENLQLVSPREHMELERNTAIKEIHRLRKILDDNGIPY